MARREIFCSPRAADRVERADAWMMGRAPGSEVLVLASTREAPLDLTANVARRSRAVFGVFRFTLGRFAAAVAAPLVASRGLAAVGPLALEAITARVVSDLARAGKLGRLATVADRPGLPRAIARTLREARVAGLSADALSRVAPDLALVHAAFEAELAKHHMADRALVLRTAIDRVRDAHKTVGGPLLVGRPLLVFDAEVKDGLEAELLGALSERSAEVLATVPSGDGRTRGALSRVLRAAEKHAEPSTLTSALTRLQVGLFEPETHERAVGAAGATSAGDVTFVSAPGESRECVEIARRIRDEAERGVRFDQIAVLLRSPGSYRPHLVEALRRAEIPACFVEGTREPDPAGRAMLALLACAAEDLSAHRFAEYLSLGEVPDATPEGEPRPAPPAIERWAIPDEELVPTAMSRADDTRKTLDLSEILTTNDPDTAPVLAGTLRAPRRWERLLIDAAVIGGKTRYKRRLAQLRKGLFDALANEEDPESAEALRIKRDLADLAALETFALPLIDDLSQLPSQALWAEWLDCLSALATRALRRPDRVLAALAELQPMAPVGPVELSEVRLVLGRRLSDLVEPPKGKRHGAVWIAPIEACRGMTFDVVIIPGLAERIFPQKVTEDPILPDAARRLIAEAWPDRRLDTADDRIEKERLQLKLAVGAARRSVVLSYPRVDMDQSRPRVPSFYGLEVLRAAEGKLPGFDELARRAEQGSAARIGWPAPEKSHDAIDDAEHDLALLEELFRLPEKESAGNARYLLGANPHLARALRFRAQRWEVARFTGADGLVMREQKAGGGKTVKPLEPALAALAKHRMGARSFSPTALQTFASCPYKFVLYTVHKLAPREVPDRIEELDPLSRGSLVHEVQFELYQRLRELGALPVVTSRLPIAIAEMETALARVESRYREDLLPSIRRVWDSGIHAIQADLIEWLRLSAEDAENEGWTPAHFELSFGLPDRGGRDIASRDEPVLLDCGILLRGSIDLVEERRPDARSGGQASPIDTSRAKAGALRATDYKTGKARAQDGEVIGHGERLQPTLYALTLEKLFPDREVFGGRLFYCTSAGGFHKVDIPLNDEARQKAQIVADVIGDAIKDAFLPAAPAPSACRFCDYRPVCGPYEEERLRKKKQDELIGIKHLRAQE